MNRFIIATAAATALAPAFAALSDPDLPRATAKDVAAPTPAQVVVSGFTNDIAMPSKHYVLSDTRNEIFVKNLIKRWRPYNDFVRFDGDAGMFLRRFPEVATISKPKDGARIVTELVSGDEFQKVKAISTELKVGERGKGEKDVYVQFVGDSITHGTYFQYSFLSQTNIVPKVHLVGLLSCGKKQYNEGRGGWTLAQYFAIPKRSDSSYHGFMQPKNGRYWGSRAFWVTAWKCVRGTQPKGFEPTYSCSRYGDCVGRFDENTGVLLNPEPGDVQFDDERKTMVRFDGSKWEAVDEKALEFGFDYGKYLEMWDIHTPEFLFVMLGTNDFCHQLNGKYDEFYQRMTAFKDSYLKANPTGKFVVCLPIAISGSSRNKAGMFTEKIHAAWWSFRRWAIEAFDNREKEGFHLLDVGVAADDDNGFLIWDEKNAECLPCENYKGKDRLTVQYGNPHPYLSYPAMSVAPAAFVQYWRDRR